MDTDGLASLLESWELRLRAEGKSEATVKAYRDGVKAYIRWRANPAQGQDLILSRDDLDAFAAGLFAQGRKGWTVTGRVRAVRLFSAWLAEKDEIERDQLAGAKAPKIDEEAIVPLTEAEYEALLRTCKGKDFHHVRDQAVIRLMHDTGARAGEVVGMKLGDVDPKAGTALIFRGKGGKGRRSGFGPQAAAAIDDYLRLRRKQPHARRPELWLGERQRSLGYAGLYITLKRRAERAGIGDFHPHRLRSTSAVEWLKAGGTVSGLMAQAGWSSADMLRRYIQASESDLAIAEARRIFGR